MSQQPPAVSTSSMEDILSRLYAKPEPLHDVLYMTSEALKSMTNRFPVDKPTGSIYSVPVRVRSSLRVHSGVPRSLDRFAEYEDADMEWAVPLGLAEWSDPDVQLLALANPLAMDINQHGILPIYHRDYRGHLSGLTTNEDVL
jgi:hypothetical protein